MIHVVSAFPKAEILQGLAPKEKTHDCHGERGGQGARHYIGFSLGNTPYEDENIVQKGKNVSLLFTDLSK